MVLVPTRELVTQVRGDTNSLRILLAYCHVFEKKNRTFFTQNLRDRVGGTTFGSEALHSEDCPEAPVGSPNLWFDAMAALTHATNYSGAIGISSDTLRAV